MSELISGKEALIALANGELVEYSGDSIHFGNARDLSVCEILSDLWMFKLKPRTITINGIDVPATFIPKEDCVVYILDDSKTSGYRSYCYEFDGDSDSNFFGLWEREDEIKQVVEALRSIFK